jgi:hypothetical protein
MDFEVMQGLERAQRLYDMQTDENGFLDEGEFEEAMSKELENNKEIDEAEKLFINAKRLVL